METTGLVQQSLSSTNEEMEYTVTSVAGDLVVSDYSGSTSAILGEINSLLEKPVSAGRDSAPLALSMCFARRVFSSKVEILPMIAPAEMKPRTPGHFVPGDPEPEVWGVRRDNNAYVTFSLDTNSFAGKSDDLDMEMVKLGLNHIARGLIHYQRGREKAAIRADKWALEHEEVASKKYVRDEDRQAALEKHTVESVAVDWGQYRLTNTAYLGVRETRLYQDGSKITVHHRWNIKGDGYIRKSGGERSFRVVFGVEDPARVMSTESPDLKRIRRERIDRNVSTIWEALGNAVIQHGKKYWTERMYAFVRLPEQGNTSSYNLEYFGSLMPWAHDHLTDEEVTLRLREIAIAVAQGLDSATASEDDVEELQAAEAAAVKAAQEAVEKAASQASKNDKKAAKKQQAAQKAAKKEERRQAQGKTKGASGPLRLTSIKITFEGVTTEIPLATGNDC
jgi:hypothetical protein